MTNRKLLIAIASVGTLGCSLSSLAEYNCSGIYIGAQAGYSHSSYNLNEFLDEHLDKDGAVGRAYVGFQFNQYFGLETGFALFSHVDLPEDFGDIKTAHWDLLVKAGMPIADSGLRVDVKAGGAYIMSKFDADDMATTLGFDDETEKEFKPVAGASVTYNFNKNIAMDVSYLHVFGDPKSGALGSPNIDMATLGVSFLFPLN